MYDGYDGIKKMSSERLLLYIRKSIESGLESFIAELADSRTINDINNNVNNLLSILKEKNIMEDYKVNSSFQLRTWNELYPRFFDRLCAKFYKYIMYGIFKKRLQYSKPVIWRHLFPFKVEDHAPDILFMMKKDWFNEVFPELDFVIEKMDDTWNINPPSISWITNWINGSSFNSTFTATLMIPYQYVNVDVLLKPKGEVVNSIHIKFL